jgi:hypothetical protein
MPFHLADTRAVADAAALIAGFGPQALDHAAARARAARDVGNHIRFCHWRQIERLIVLLHSPEPVGTVH